KRCIVSSSVCPGPSTGSAGRLRWPLSSHPPARRRGSESTRPASRDDERPGQAAGLRQRRDAPPRRCGSRLAVVGYPGRFAPTPWSVNSSAASSSAACAVTASSSSPLGLCHVVRGEQIAISAVCWIDVLRCLDPLTETVDKRSAVKVHLVHSAPFEEFHS